MPKIDYTSLEEWRREHRMTIEKMAEVASGRGAKVSAKTLGTAFRDGLPLHGRVLFAWEVSWLMVLSASVLAGILSLLMSIGGLPELDDCE